MRWAVLSVLAVCGCPRTGGELTEACAALVPDRIHLRDGQQSFNQRYDAWLCDGEVYLRERAEAGPWESVALPARVQGRVATLSMDDAFLEVADDEGAVWLTWSALDDPGGWSWARHQGMPFGLGRKNWLPDGHLAWGVSSVSRETDGHYVDPSGWPREVGSAGCTHLFVLLEGGQHLAFNDGWLPADWGYEVCTPERGRLRAVALASSGSRHLVMGRHGDLFTRVFDFDLSGGNTAFADYQDYSYDDQRHLDDDRDRAFQLPAWPWFEQPKVPGRITDRVSLHKTGTGVQHALMRVEGWDAQGHTGFWEKDLHDVVESPTAPGPWTFVRTDLPVLGTEVDNQPADLSWRDLGPAEDACYGWNLGSPLPEEPDGRLRTEDWSAELVGLHPTCSPAVLRIHVGADEVHDLVLHTTEAFRTRRLDQRGLTDEPRPRSGAIEVPANLHATPLDELHPILAALLDEELAGQRFTPVDVEVSAHEVQLRGPSGLRWDFSRLPCDAPELTLVDPADPINGDHGLPFADLFLGEAASQQREDGSSERDIATLGDLLSTGW